ncbi:anti-sigma factor [Paenibacillus lemnae]|nr:anti-sigma factor [Paenibacillus lemnae]
METVWDLPDNDLRVYRLRQHVKSCPSCAMEYELWQDSMNMVQHLKYEPAEEHVEAVNRNVMDRIYRDFPWLVEENQPEKTPGRMMRKRLILWIAGFAALFGSSFLFFAIRGTLKASDPETPRTPVTGILPTGVAGSGSPVEESMHYNIPDPGSGIMDPLVAGMDPSQPQYWMVLSIIGVGLALFFLMRLNRASRC